MKRTARLDKRQGIDAVVAATVLGVFGLDLAAYLGFTVWVLYFIPLLASLFSRRPQTPLLAGVITAALVLLGYWFSPPPPLAELLHLVLVNRAMAGFALVSLGLIGHQFVSNKQRLALQDWINSGHLELQTALRGEQSVGEVSQKALAFLASYLGAQVGSVYTLEGEAALRRQGGYGLSFRLGDERAEVEVGQTLIGQAANSGGVIVVHDVPDNYLDVSSGVGHAKPGTLLIAPTASDGTVNGVFELGFLAKPPAEAHAFLGTVTPSIGVALRSARFRQRQAELLEETQLQAEELQAQQEELKATNEELEQQGQLLLASQRELEESNARLEEQARVLEGQKEQLMSARDVLKRKAIELERASRYKSEFLANMSHELRTPLNSSLILAKLLADNKPGNLSPEQVQYVKNIYAAGNDLLTLINDILDLSKIEAGKLDLQVERVDLQSLFAALAERFQPLARAKNLHLSATLAPDAPRDIECDPVRLQQILSNLLSNAIKFTERGHVTMLAEALDDGLRIRVSDTGIGVASEQHEIIFEAFRQADGTTVRKFGGTGLGLSISRELAKLLGGHIGIESQVGRGSTFMVNLPSVARFRSSAASRAEATPRDGSSEASANDVGVSIGSAASRLPSTRNGNGRTNGFPRTAVAPVDDDRNKLAGSSRVLLMVEDDAHFAKVLRDLAHELGFQCLVAGSADEGLELARRVRPFAIILDIGLPDYSGLTVLEHLKSDLAIRHIPVHVVSAHDYQRVAYEKGAFGYALKPVKREELNAAFRSLEHELARNSKSILVVEDDTVQREAIAKLLSNEGITVTQVSTPHEALRRLGTTCFDCIVLDLMLPNSSGFELLDQIGKSLPQRAGNRSAQAPIIVYTARALNHEEEQRLRQHARSVIIKGAHSPERLLEEVTLFLHQVATELPEQQRQMLLSALDREAIFVGRRILIVEDDVRSIYALSSALQPKGAAIEIARNGIEALQRLEAHPPVDLVLMDIMMPEMGGLEATREIRKQSAGARLPIIALTAKAMPDDRLECLRAGASDYIAKPVNVDKLLSLCRVWLPR